MKVASVLSLSALALAAPTPESERSHIPLSRERHEAVTRADGSVDFENYLATVKHSLLKYNPQIKLGGRLENAGLILKKRGGAANVPLTDFVEGGSEDEEYYGPGTVSGQKFTFDFDTGSSDTFVPGPKCGAAQGCSGATKYDLSGTDRHNTTTVTYGSGQVSGENYLDSVTIGGLTATNQNIISLTQASGFNGTPSDSLMGMAFQSIANSKSSPFFFSLIQQGKCMAQEFAFYLGRKKSNTQGASQMTLCGTDTSKYSGALTKVPVTNQTYWEVALDGAQVGSLPMLPTTNGNAAIDTGTTLIIAPTVAATSIFAEIPGSVPIPLSVGVPPILGFAYPCASSPKVSLNFANKAFAINPLDFNFGTLNDDLGISLPLLGSTYCIAGIAGADINPGENLYVVGDTFLKNWYSVFHYDSPSSASVSFAAAKGNQ